MKAPLSEAALRARRLGVLGGSFDPPHHGHLHVAERARAAFVLDHVLLVPAARPPHKPERVLADGPQRLAMLQELTRELPWLSPWAIELQRSGPSYTVDTLRELRRRVDPGVRLYVLLGQDNAAGFPGWREAETIVSLAQPIVVPRANPGDRSAVDPASIDPARSAPVAEAPPRVSEFARTRLALGRLDCPAVAVSSTELRARLARGEFPPELPGSVADYLRRHALYARRAGAP